MNNNSNKKINNKIIRNNNRNNNKKKNNNTSKQQSTRICTKEEGVRCTAIHNVVVATVDNDNKENTNKKP